MKPMNALSTGTYLKFAPVQHPQIAEYPIEIGNRAAITVSSSMLSINLELKNKAHLYLSRHF